MGQKRGRPAVLQQRILTVLLQHHKEAGWEQPMPRGELLARLHGWPYGRQVTQRPDAYGELAPLAYTGIDRTRVSDQAYESGHASLKRALLVMYGLGHIRVGDRRYGGMKDAGQEIRSIEADLAAAEADPEGVWRRSLEEWRQLPVKPIRPPPASPEEYLARRRAALAFWQSGKGRPILTWVHQVMLTDAGRSAAEALPVDLVAEIVAQGWRDHGQTLTLEIGEAAMERNGEREGPTEPIPALPLVPHSDAHPAEAWQVRQEGDLLAISGPGRLELMLHEFDPRRSAVAQLGGLPVGIAYPLCPLGPEPQLPDHASCCLQLLAGAPEAADDSCGDRLCLGTYAQWPLPSAFAAALRAILLGQE